MNPTTILVILLTIVAMRPFFEVPDAAARSDARAHFAAHHSPSDLSFFTRFLTMSRLSALSRST